MGMNYAISVDGVAKQFRLGGNGGGTYRTLRESLTDAARAPWRRLRRALAAPCANGHAPPRRRLDAIWALRDVSFEVRAGEVVGILGRNGAGKSTLLKILSRITDPTCGRIDYYGRVASLLEVGTGFHHELSGRENIFLNGAILGMTRREIQRKFDAIVAFSEVEDFLDTPVKRYSSGMYVRLAFAVAAHLEPEILVVDEVLAVGDASFQKKCLNKMQDVGKSGRTVLFVSHNMPAVARLCPRAILLNEGRVAADGPAPQVISTYLHHNVGIGAERQWPDASAAPGNDVVRLRAVRVRGEDGAVCQALDIRQPVGLEMEFDVLRGGSALVPGFSVANEEGVVLFMTYDSDPQWKRTPRPPGRYVSTAWVPGNFLAEGTLTVGASVSTQVPALCCHAAVSDAVAFQVVDSDEGDTARGDFSKAMPGVIRPMLRWDNRHTAGGSAP
jgi:lipopolysaccharide transport system ATP-binding protein